LRTCEIVPVTPYSSRICKELLWNQEFRRSLSFYPLDSRELLYRNTLFFFLEKNSFGCQATGDTLLTFIGYPETPKKSASLASKTFQHVGNQGLGKIAAQPLLRGRVFLQKRG